MDRTRDQRVREIKGEIGKEEEQREVEKKSVLTTVPSSPHRLIPLLAQSNAITHSVLTKHYRHTHTHPHTASPLQANIEQAGLNNEKPSNIKRVGDTTSLYKRQQTQSFK